jgi:hypothetical protein
MRLPCASLLCLAALALAGTGCDSLNPRPGPIRAMEPRPNPPVPAVAATAAGAVPAPTSRTQARVRRNRWLTRFWEELTPAQRRRVESRMHRTQPPLASDTEQARRLWDRLGLEERGNLVFGSGPVRQDPPVAGGT